MVSKKSFGNTMSIQTKMEELEVSKSEFNDSIFGIRMVTIAVGPEKVKFVAHEKVVSQYSVFLRTTLAKEDGIEYLTLPDTEPQTFNHFMKWAYGAKIGSPDLNRLANGLTASSFDLVKLYVFAQKYDATVLQDSTISAIYSHLSDGCENWGTLGSDTGVLKYLVDHVDPGAHLYTLVTRAMAYWMFSAAAPKLMGGMTFDYGGWNTTSLGGIDNQTSLTKLSSWGVAVPQAVENQIVGEDWGSGWSSPQKVNMDNILDSMPITLLRPVVKEFSRMKSLGWSATSTFTACVGTKFDYHLPGPAHGRHYGQ